MIKVLANDGLSSKAISNLELLGFKVFTESIPQEKLADFINFENIEVLCVRSATKVNKALIDSVFSLKLVIRGGVGMDNIDIPYSEEKGIVVSNTPGASTYSVAELTIAHILSMARYLFAANRRMPAEGVKKMKQLKSEFSSGFEVKGKTLGIIGFGRIGQEVARIAIALGMNVIACDSKNKTGIHELELITASNSMKILVQMHNKDYLLSHSNIISLHVPYDDKPQIGHNEFRKMQKGTVLVNVSRGGVVDEDELLKAIKNGTILRAALDVYEHEPKPKKELLNHPSISMTPHIGASTVEAQERIGDEIVHLIQEHFKK